MSKQILSWDVGIKNLAYCMLEKNNEKDDFKILKWGVINLVDDRQKCEFNLRGGNVCEENAKFVIYNKDKTHVDEKNDKHMLHTCTRHKIKMMPVLEEIVYKGKVKECDKIKCIECGEYAKYKIEQIELYWCDKHYEKSSKPILKTIASKKFTVANCNKQPIQELSEKLFSRLDKLHSEFMNVSEVLIENQPSLRNPTMKTIASILYSYFVMRGIIDKKVTKSNIDEIRFVSPSNKLKVNETNTTKILDKGDTKENVYKLTKKLGVKYCRALISKEDDEIINKVKKKDDMADAFLQGFQYLFKIVPKKFFDKIEKIGFDETKKPIKKINKKIDIEE